MSRAQQLYQLQLLDSEVDKINQQLTEIATQLGESEALRQARARAEAEEKALRQAQASMPRYEKFWSQAMRGWSR